MERDIIVNLDPRRAACVMDYDLKEYHQGRINPLSERIQSLEDAIGTDKDKRIVVKSGVFPADAVESDESRALLWAYKQLPTPDVPEPPEPKEWKLLVFMHEIMGPEGPTGATGPEGPAGHDGSGIMLRGTVENVADLFTIENVRDGWSWMVRATDEVYMYIGRSGGGALPANWKNLGKIAGIKGDTGARGPQGIQGVRGEKGASGGISSFLLSWVVSTATNAAISGVMMEVNTAINDAINDAIMEMTNTMQDVAQSAVDKTIEEMLDEFTGDKGDKGDKGDDGKDGKDGAACTIRGHFDTQLELVTLGAKEAGSAYLVGEENILWMWLPRMVGDVDLGDWKEIGNIKGPKGDKGDDANWKLQLLNQRDELIGSVIEIKPTEGDTPNIYIKGDDGIVLEKALGVVNGFVIKNKHPIPSIASVTRDKFLTNDGTKAEWVDISFDDEPKEVIKLKSPDNKVWNLTVSIDGRLNVTEEVA